MNDFSEAEAGRVVASPQSFAKGPQNTRDCVSKALGQKSRQETFAQQSPWPKEWLANQSTDCHKYRSEKKPSTEI